MTGEARQGDLLFNEPEAEVGPESTSSPAQVCRSDREPGEQPRQAQCQREMSEGDVMEKSKDGEERGVGRGVQGKGGEENRGPAFSQTPASVAGSRGS